jgi:DNA-binding LacI/PurR family transcriptional regulator
VIGFDDTPVAGGVGLTSLSQALPGAAARCVDVLTRSIDAGIPDQPDHILLEPRLVVRRSA